MSDLAVGCILTGDWEADLDCTQFHEDAPWTCCKWCERDGGEHCGMCARFEADDEDPPLCTDWDGEAAR